MFGRVLKRGNKQSSDHEVIPHETGPEDQFHVLVLLTSGNYVFEWPYVAHKNSFAGTPVCCLQKMGSKRSSIEQLL